MAKKKPILDLSAIIPEREPIEFEGERYEMRSFVEFDPRELAKIAVLGERHVAVSKGADISDEEVAEAESIAADLVAIYTTMPPEAIAKLPYGVRLKVIKVFTDLSAL